MMIIILLIFCTSGYLYINKYNLTIIIYLQLKLIENCIPTSLISYGNKNMVWLGPHYIYGFGHSLFINKSQVISECHKTVF